MSHLFDSLKAAAEAAIAHDNIPGNIVHAEWAKTYRCSAHDVEQALKIAENGSRKLPEEIASSCPPIIATEGEGK